MTRLLLLFLLWGGAAAAQETRQHQRGVLLPGVGAADPRQPVDRDALPWRALARVQTELGGRCTGVMVGPARVLTAAHCLVAPRSGRYVQPRSVHVLLGYDRGEWVARARVASFVAAPGYVPGRGPAGADWALLTLDAAIAPPDRILPLLRDAPPPRTPVMLGGYQQDRPEVLTADSDCRLLGLQRHAGDVRTLVHDCAGTRGSSGAPLLARGPDGRWAVIGVQAAVDADIALGHAAPAAAVAAVE
ncbi:trypsin-like serine peptidase [Falsiroseomonas sp. CW058]|uniref:trypsin-like serine peptidase n=1 Tax=Falsiroseomonas sp. CW058 TaxID=3388664 RepID=UPI003D31084C